MKAFEALVGFITGNRAKSLQEHEEFLAFYSDLVKVLPDELAREFGSIPATTYHKGKEQNYRIELTVTDLMWWRTIIDEGGRFMTSTLAIQRDIWDHMNKKSLTGSLTDEQKLELLNIMNEAD